MYIMGYIPQHNRVYLADKNVNVYGYTLSLTVVEYQTAILRGDMDSANDILPTLPKDQLNKVARFLEGRGSHFHFGRRLTTTDINLLRSQGPRSSSDHRPGPQI